jgi:four helix bundle protein
MKESKELRGHRDLLVWQKAMALVTEVYRTSGTFPGDERFGLTSQIGRAAVSVPSNVAEGHGRTSTREFHRFLGQARGSLLEAETQIEIARNLEYISKSAAEQLLRQSREVAGLLNGLRTWAESRATQTRTQLPHEPSLPSATQS